jgi:hypothetical protein
VRQRNEHQIALEKSRDELGDNAFASVWSTGRSLNMELAVTLALQCLDEQPSI